MRPSRLVAAAAAALAALPAAALAHAPIPGVGAFWNGALHPLLALPHLLFLAAFGLLLGQHVPRASRIGLPAFAAGLAPSVALAGSPGPAVAGLAAASAVAGLLVAVGRAPAAAVVPLALAGAALVGLDSAPEGAAPATAPLARAGVIAGALLIVVLAGGLAAALARPWQKLGLRVGGSWIAAVSLLVLAVDLAGPRA